MREPNKDTGVVKIHESCGSKMRACRDCGELYCPKCAEACCGWKTWGRCVECLFAFRRRNSERSRGVK